MGHVRMISHDYIVKSIPSVHDYIVVLELFDLFMS